MSTNEAKVKKRKVAWGITGAGVKIAYGIGDTMLTNAANMSLKAFVQVYVVPSDFEEKTVSTILPNGKEMKLRIRKEDEENTRKLEKMEDVTVLGSPQKIRAIFEKWFGQ